MRVKGKSGMKFSNFVYLASCLSLFGCVQKGEVKQIEQNLYANDSKQTKSFYKNENILNCMKPSGHHVYAKEFTCPLGGEKFSALRLGTHSRYGTSLDWESLSYMRFPVPLPICPSNGMPIYKKDFTEEELIKIKAIITSPEYQKMYSEKHATFFLYASLLKSLEVKAELWWYFLNATWEADLCGDKSRYQAYANDVIEHGNERLNDRDVKPEDQWVIQIVVANMHRRIGKFEIAKKLAENIGTPSFKDEGFNQHLILAKRLLLKAISEKNINRVPIEEERQK